jgi:hypothetical protein
MPDPDDPREAGPPNPGELKANADEATIQAEVPLQDVQADERAMDEARKQGAVPFERVKKDERP